LTGGAGSDVFVYNIGDSAIGSEDTITDFAVGELLVFGDHSFLGENSFTGSGVFEVRYVSGTTTLIELDRDGDGIVDELINIEGTFDFSSDGQELTAISSSPGVDDWVG